MNITLPFTILVYRVLKQKIKLKLAEVYFLKLEIPTHFGGN